MINPGDTKTSIDESIKTSKALQILMQRTQKMIQLSLIQDAIMSNLGLGKDKMEKWYQSLQETVKRTLNQFNRETELMEKRVAIEFSYRGGEKVHTSRQSQRK